MKKIIIALDGWSSCGKSTLAKQLANYLNYIYVDSGAMYRAITLYFLQNNIAWKEEEQVLEALKKIKLKFKNESGKSTIYLNDCHVEDLIRELRVAEKVSEIAALKAVRIFAVEQQQEMGKQKGIVMDGRDIGTVVFPMAELKIFMTADNETRVGRRFNEMKISNPNISIAEVRQNIESRDFSDSNREISPLRKAADALVLDNTRLTTDQQFKIALDWAQAKIEER